MSFSEFKKYVTGKFNSGLENASQKLQRVKQEVLPILKKKAEGVKLKAGKIGKGVIVITLSGLLLLNSLVGCGDVKKQDSDVPTRVPVASASKDPSKPNKTPSVSDSPNIYIDTFQGEDYYFCSQDYVYDLASKALNNCKSMLTSVDGVTNMGKNGFYQDFFNEDMLAAITYTESTNRIKHADGSPLVSSTGALGMCQLEPDTINTINRWLEDTMTIKDKKYSLEDTSDPLKSLELATLAFIRNSKNETKPSDETYKQLGVPYSQELEEKLLYAMYFYGEGNFEQACQNKTIFDTYLNPDWRDANGHNYVYTVLKNKQMLMAKKQQQNTDYGMGR